MRAIRLALMLPAALALAACDDMGMGGGNSSTVQPAPTTPGQAVSSNPSTNPAAAAAAADAAGNPPM